MKQLLKQLQQEVQNLKHISSINETNNPLLKEPKQQPTHSKNAEMASNNNGAQPKQYGNNKHDKLHRANHENI